MSPDEVLQLARLKRFLYPMVPIALAFAVTYAVGAVFLRSQALVGATITVTILAIGLSIALVWARRGAVTGPALLAGYSLLIVVAVSSLFIQFAAAALVIIALTAATLVISYVAGQKLKMFLIATFICEVVVIVVCIFLPPLFEQPPVWIQRVVTAAAIAIAAGLALLLIWADSVRLRMAVSARDEFLALAAHELRTPVAAASLTLDGMARKNAAGTATPEWMLRQAENTRRALRRLSQLVEALLDVTRIGANKLELNREQTDLSEVARELLERFAAASSQVTLEAPAPVVGDWDRLKVEQVVVNLLSNAVKYGDQKPVIIAVFERDGHGIIEVRDQGIGISAEAQARLFQRFHREAAVRHFGGLGLGLWISRNIVDAHGGTIQVSSEAGKGTTFRVELPMRVTPQPGPADLAARHLRTRR